MEEEETNGTVVAEINSAFNNNLNGARPQTAAVAAEDNGVRNRRQSSGVESAGITVLKPLLRPQEEHVESYL